MGAFVTAIAALGFSGGAMWVWFQKLQRVDIPEERTFFVSAWVIGLVTGILALAQSPGFFSGLIAVVVVLGSAAVLVLTVLAPQQADAPIQVGQTIPEFTAYDENGESFDSRELHNKKLLIKFFRGHW